MAESLLKTFMGAKYLLLFTLAIAFFVLVPNVQMKQGTTVTACYGNSAISENDINTGGQKNLRLGLGLGSG